MKIFFRIIISLALLIFLYFKINWQGLGDVLISARWSYVCLSFFALLFAWLINSYKWQFILKPFGLARPVIYLFKLNLITFFYSLVLPGGQLVGEVLKCLHLAKNEQEKSLFIFSVFLDRLTGFLAYVLLGFVALVFSVVPVTVKLTFLTIFGAIIIIALIGYLAIFSHGLSHWLTKIIIHLSWGRKIHSFLSAIKQKSVFNFSLVHILAITCLSLLFQLVVSFYVYLAAQSLGIPIGLVDIVWIFSLISVILVIPLTYAGFGLREGGFVYLLSFFGIAGSSAFSLSLLVFFIGALVAALGGFWLLIKGIGPSLK